jgi:hypothetical protein
MNKVMSPRSFARLIAKDFPYAPVFMGPSPVASELIAENIKAHEQNAKTRAIRSRLKAVFRAASRHLIAENIVLLSTHGFEVSYSIFGQPNGAVKVRRVESPPHQAY